MAEIILTKEQQAVVDDRDGTLLVSAAAGSGKTKVLIDRVLKRVSDENYNVDDFLMITFTQAAAAELRGKLIGRLSELLAENPENRHLQKQLNRAYLAQISTIHSFCTSVLRDYAHAIDLPADFRICDEQEAGQIREDVLIRTLEWAYSNGIENADVRAAVDVLGGGRDDDSLAKLILQLYESIQCWDNPAARTRELLATLDVSHLEDVGETIWGSYLIREMQAYLRNCCEVFSTACSIVNETPSLEAYRVTFNQNFEEIQRLATLQTWEEFHSVKPDYGKLKGIRKCDVPDLQERVKRIRDGIKKGINSRLEKFSLCSADALADLEVSAQSLRGVLLVAERFADLFRKEKRRKHLLDYNDLEHEMLRLVLHPNGYPTSYGKEISQRFCEIMIDEYQDTNEVQDRIFHAISKEGKNLFFVGDVKQSIYRFRLADPRIFQQKYMTFADRNAAKKGEPRKILLSDNFRSAEAVLEAANDVFCLTMTPRVGGLRYTDAEALRYNRKFAVPEDPAIELHCIDADSMLQVPGTKREHVEADFIARRIRQMLDEQAMIPDGEGLRPVRPEDFVILMRALSSKAGIYIEALQKYGLRGVCGSENLFEAEEIGFLISLLQVLDNPHQDIPLLAVLLSPVFRFSANALALIRGKDKVCDIYDALAATQEGREFRKMIRDLRDFARENSLYTLVVEIVDRLYLREIYGRRAENCGHHIDAFFTLSERFDSGERYGLSEFLRYLEGMKQRGMEAEQTPGEGVIRLMTIHKSKGLEFPVVILADLMKQFNASDTKATVLVDSELGIGASIYDRQQGVKYPTVAKRAIANRIRRENISEEMRVLYVAMTRAQYRMIMTCCDKGMKGKLSSLAQSLTVPLSEGVLEGAACLGDWVLMAALTRTEAGELFKAGDKPDCTSVHRIPWKITFREGSLEAREKETVQWTSGERELELCVKPYAFSAACATPSKVTATQMKGRELDHEAASEVVSAPVLRLTKPSFTEGERQLSATERGTAIHLAMQYLRYEACTEEASIRSELDRLVQERFLSKQQAEAVDPKKILAFFHSPLGRRVLSAKKLIREFKFSVLEDGGTYDPELRGERLLLQGVTDCCILEEDGITIIDFKSDYLRPGQEPERGEYYRGQLETYGRALSRIFELPVREKLLYFFSTGAVLSL